MNDEKDPTVDQENEGGICFVIMPFGGWFNKYYRDIYKPAITDAGLEPKRADDLYRPSPIVKDIWQFTKTSKVLLADLTHRNPNVFYELGLAHAIKKPVILVTENLDDVPFDLKGLRIIEYDKNESNWGEILKLKITKAIKETVASPTKSIAAAFMDESDLEERAVSKDEKQILELQQDVEMLKRQLISGTTTTTTVTRQPIPIPSIAGAMYYGKSGGGHTTIRHSAGLDPEDTSNE